MKTGMLWFDNSQKPLKEKVEEAASYYQEKYGKVPTLCFVNPSTLAGKEGSSNGVDIRETRTVMPDHFWIGVDTKNSGNGNGRQQ